MTNQGVALEARVQRLFLAQGIFAERSLSPAADSGRRLLATDIDVLISEYASGYHLTRRHAECKSGRRVKTLDRILWLHGVRSLLRADASYLVLRSFNEGAAEFARQLDIDVMTVKQLDTWEEAFDIDGSHWPCRSDFEVIDSIRTNVRNLGKQRHSSRVDSLLYDACQFIEVESWHVFEYRKLNQLFRILGQLGETYERLDPKEPRRLYVRYCASALLVRLSQYLLSVCLDISRVPISDLRSYLTDRLTYGNQEPKHVRGLVQSTVGWISQALKERGIELPPEADTRRLFRPPSFAEGLVGLTEKLLSAPNEAKYLPIAMEVEQFGTAEDPDLFPRLGSAWKAGRDLVALVRAFSVASLEVNGALLSPIGVTRTSLENKTAEDKIEPDGRIGQRELL